jgi:PleD family two-component response regulator
LGGSIDFDSKVGVGTTFVVKLKFQKGGDFNRLGSLEKCMSDTSSLSSNATSPGPPPGSLSTEGLKAHVLVAEDNVTNQAVISRMLTKLGCTFMVVENGQEVIDELKRLLSTNQRPYDLILMDCQMPIMDGKQLNGSNMSRIPSDGICSKIT